MKDRLPYTFAVASLAMTAFLSAQQVLTVGPGQSFDTIGAAVAAAAPGDTVLAVGGTYNESIDIDKPLQLVGRGALLQTAPLFGPSIRIHDLGPGEPVLLRGFRLASGSGAFMGITVARCAGPVTLHDLGNQGGSERWSVSVEQCPQVHLARAFLGSVVGIGSVLALEQCVVEAPAWSPALWLRSGSTMSCSVCTVQGATTPPVAAVWMQDGGTLLATRSSLIGGGTGTLGQPAIDAFNGGSVLVDPSCSLGTSGSGPAVVGTVAVPFAFSSLTASTDSLNVTAVAHGPANGIFVTLFSAVSAASVTPFGIAWLDVAGFSPLYVGVHDPVSRQHTAIFGHGALPAGLTIALQSVGLDSNGLTLGLPTVLSFP